MLQIGKNYLNEIFIKKLSRGYKVVNYQVFGNVPALADGIFSVESCCEYGM